MSAGLLAATTIVDTLIRAGIRIAEQREEAIEALVRDMKPSPEDIAGGYFADRETATGVAVNLDELDELPHDTEPPATEDT